MTFLFVQISFLLCLVHLKSYDGFQLEVDSQVVGRKDMSRSAFDVWKEVSINPADLVSSILQKFICTNLFHYRFFKRENQREGGKPRAFQVTMQILISCTPLFLTGIDRLLAKRLVLIWNSIISFSQTVNFILTLQWWIWIDYGWNLREFLTPLLPWSNDAKDSWASWPLPASLFLCILTLCIKHISETSKQFAMVFFSSLFWLEKVRCLDALGASDSILRYILRTQQMSLYGKILLFTYGLWFYLLAILSFVWCSCNC